MDAPFDLELWMESDEEILEETPVFDDLQSDENSDIDIDTRDLALSRIEGLVLSFLTQLRRSLSPGTDEQTEDDSIERLQCKKITLQLADRQKTRPDGSFGVRSLCFPRNSKGASAKPIAQLFRVLDMTHEALADGITATKRDMYYRDVPLFKSQSVVDRLVDDLAATFHLERSDLNVRATSKGLVCGAALVIYLNGGETVEVNDSEGTLIPAGEDISHFEVNGTISWVVIVEKDAVFQTLCRLQLTDHPSMPGRGIMITGKGYPDMATRQLVKTLSDNLPSTVPILALVDGDPYGLDILSVYKFGSIALKHEDNKLAANRVEWVGVWTSELKHLNIDGDALIPISRSDQKKALAMLRRSSAVMPWRWKKELMHMLHSRRKAEIEILSSANCNTASAQGQLCELTDPRYPGESTVTSRSILLAYLRDKIASFID